MHQNYEKKWKNTQISTFCQMVTFHFFQKISKMKTESRIVFYHFLVLLHGYFTITFVKIVQKCEKTVSFHSEIFEKTYFKKLTENV